MLPQLRNGVTVTRVTRAYVEVTAVPDLQLQFGDMLFVVGEEADVAKASKFLGNSLKSINETNYIPIFVGIAPDHYMSTSEVYGFIEETQDTWKKVRVFDSYMEE